MKMAWHSNKLFIPISPCTSLLFCNLVFSCKFWWPLASLSSCLICALCLLHHCVLPVFLLFLLFWSFFRFLKYLFISLFTLCTPHSLVMDNLATIHVNIESGPDGGESLSSNGVKNRLIHDPNRRCVTLYFFNLFILTKIVCI